MTAEKIRLLTFSTLYPNSIRPGHGIFVETRLRELVATGKVESRVVAPVPWFFSTHPRFGEYARSARIPLREVHNGLDVQHPRYFLPPKVGMNLAPFTLAKGAMPAVQNLLDEGYDFDVFDAHYYYPDGVAAALLARRFDRPFTVTARGSDINLLSTYAFPRKLMQWASRRARASIGVSEALTQVMANVGMPTQNLLMLPNGVDHQRFGLQPKAHAREMLGWPLGPTLISVGNLVENKGHHLVIQALLSLPEFRLFIVGEGPKQGALERMVDRLDLSARVKFLGRLDQAQLAICYNAADILVLASSREGWPNVLLESMACGTPVVATQVGGVPEIVTSPDAGRLMDSETSMAVVAAVVDLWKTLPDRATVRLCAQGCSWQSTTDAQLKLFSSIACKTPVP
jgi:teichuronic acid biosynthesis glycosyltransferase TuaC